MYDPRGTSVPGGTPFGTPSAKRPLLLYPYSAHRSIRHSRYVFDKLLHGRWSPLCSFRQARKVWERRGWIIVQESKTGKRRSKARTAGKAETDGYIYIQQGARVEHVSGPSFFHRSGRNGGISFAVKARGSSEAGVTVFGTGRVTAQLSIHMYAHM